MPKTADTADVRQLVDQGAQLVEVLPEVPYAEAHLPGALNIPLAAVPERAPFELDPGRPVVVYCYDHECDLSARGAHLLEAIGFPDVYDYVVSKAAWLADGLPVEGTKQASKRAGAIARPAPTCDLVDTIGDMVGRFSDDFELCVVVDKAGVVLGVVRKDVVGLPPATPLLHVMQAAPPSVRPSISAAELAASMADDDRDYVLVTHLDGVLIGIIERADLYGQR
jgi:rhodanese-related sulfurtransferase